VLIAIILPALLFFLHFSHVGFPKLPKAFNMVRKCQRGSTEPEKGVFLKCELSMVSTAGSLQAQYLVIALAPGCCVHLSLKTASRGDHA